MTEGEQKRLAEYSVDAFITARICLVALAIAVMLCFRLSVRIEHSAVLFCFIAFVINSVFWGCLVKYVTNRRAQYKEFIRNCIAGSFITDVLFLTATIYYTGGAASPLIVFYLPPVMIVSVLTTLRAGFWAAGIALSCYLSFLFSPLGKSSILSGDAQYYQLLGLFSAHILIVIAADYLRRKLVGDKLLAEKRRLDIMQLNATQEILINGIPDGVILTDSNDSIVRINDLALEMLSAKGGDLIGKSLEKTFQEYFEDLNFEELSVGRHELSLHTRSGDGLKIGFTVSAVQDTEGKSCGLLYILQDVSKNPEKLLALQDKLAKLLSEPSEPARLIHSKLENFVGESEAMQEVFSKIEKVASSNVNVLVRGESGTGKELAAHAIHVSGKRASAPFIALNCGAVPEGLLESELFGHKKGAFTGASSDQIGMFQRANGGTLFLDEIGEMPLHLQAKLLRAIQEKKIRCVGGDEERPVDVRIISATNRNLQEEVNAGRFREDLFYRLDVVEICMPPLRERMEELPLLVNSILKNLTKNKKMPVITPAAMQRLFQYNYPGNVRELENALERALVLGGDVILPEHLVLKQEDLLPQKEDDFSVKLDDALGNLERNYIERALKASDGNQNQAAALLGISTRSLRYRLKKYSE